MHAQYYREMERRAAEQQQYNNYLTNAYPGSAALASFLKNDPRVEGIFIKKKPNKLLLLC